MFDENPFSLARECSSCYGEFPVLFTFGGSTKERCADCHNAYAAGHGMR